MERARVRIRGNVCCVTFGFIHFVVSLRTFGAFSLLSPRGGFAIYGVHMMFQPLNSYEKKQQEASQLEAAISAVERRAAEENAAKTTEIANLEKRFAAEVEAVKQEHAREIEQAEQRLEQRLVSAQAVESAKATQITRDIENALNERDRSTELRVAAEGAYEGLRTEFERQVQGNRNLHKALAEVRAQYAETEANMRSELAENLAKAQEAHQTEAQAMSAALEKTIEELENDKYKSDCRGIELEERMLKF